jgi:hypothetical protein
MLNAPPPKPPFSFKSQIFAKQLSFIDECLSTVFLLKSLHKHSSMKLFLNSIITVCNPMLSYMKSIGFSFHLTMYEYCPFLNSTPWTKLAFDIPVYRHTIFSFGQHYCSATQFLITGQCSMVDFVTCTVYNSSLSISIAISLRSLNPITS